MQEEVEIEEKEPILYFEDFLGDDVVEDPFSMNLTKEFYRIIEEEEGVQDDEDPLTTAKLSKSSFTNTSLLLVNELNILQSDLTESIGVFLHQEHMFHQFEESFEERFQSAKFQVKELRRLLMNSEKENEDFVLDRYQQFQHYHWMVYYLNRKCEYVKEKLDFFVQLKKRRRNRTKQIFSQKVVNLEGNTRRNRKVISHLNEMKKKEDEEFNNFLNRVYGDKGERRNRNNEEEEEGEGEYPDEDVTSRLRKENRQLQLDLNVQYEDVYRIEKSAQEVHEMMVLFHTTLLEQTEQIEHINSLAERSRVNVGKAKDTLKEIDEGISESMFRFFYAYLYLFGALLLLVMNFTHG